MGSMSQLKRIDVSHNRLVRFAFLCARDSVTVQLMVCLGDKRELPYHTLTCVLQVAGSIPAQLLEDTALHYLSEHHARSHAISSQRL